MAVSDDQIFAFDQQQAKIAGEMRLFRIALVETAGRQQADARVRPGAIGGQPPAQFVEKGCKPPRIHRAQQIAGGARESEPVFQRIAHPHRGPHPVGQDAPFARRAAADIGGVEMELMPLRRRRAVHDAPIMGAAGHDAGGQIAVGDQRLGGINVRDHPFEQVGALGEAAFDMRPFVRADQQWHRAKRPGAFLLVAGQAERHAKLDRLPPDMIGQRRGVALRLRRQPFQHRPPARGHGGRGIREQIPRRCGGEIGIGPSIRPGERGIGVGGHHSPGGLKRRSSVMGNSLAVSAAGMSTGPGVWP